MPNRWRATLDLRDLIPEGVPDKQTFEVMRTLLVQELRKVPAYDRGHTCEGNSRTDDDFFWMVEGLEVATLSDFDILLNGLYDWGDDERVIVRIK